MVNYKQKM